MARSGATRLVDGDDGVVGLEVGEGLHLEAVDPREGDVERERDALRGGDAGAQRAVAAGTDVDGDAR